jgi:formamidopyrimidine-DNA glycosylase
MPELPEVHTTVTGLQKILPGKRFVDVWSDMWSTSKLAKNTIKDRGYFSYFKKYALGTKILRVRRRAKHILIDLENGCTVIIHMKMTGHLMYGSYVHNEHYNGKEWAWIPKKKIPLFLIHTIDTFMLCLHFQITTTWYFVTHASLAPL